MNVGQAKPLQGLRSKFYEVQWELSNKISPKGNAKGPTPDALSSPEQIRKDSSPLDTHKRQKIKCGAELLLFWQEAWVKIHKANEENYDTARQTDRLMVDIHTKIQKQNDALISLKENLVNLPVMQEEIHKLTAKIGSLCEDFDILEAGLFELENINETLEFQRQLRQQRLALAQYRERKNLDLNTEKIEAAYRHNEKVEEYESRLHLKLRERQKAFEAEFEQDMKAFWETRVNDGSDNTPVSLQMHGTSPALSETKLAEQSNETKEGNEETQHLNESEADERSLENFLQESL